MIGHYIRFAISTKSEMHAQHKTMALTQLWKSAPGELQEKHIQQVISFAGDGKLRDGGTASKEFRDFLASVPASFLARYATECLNEKFDSGCFALQDVINEIGKRIGFRIEQGRYRGSPTELGFDGLWFSADGSCLVVEVKTTDAYRIDLDTVATYRKRLVTERKILEQKCSILLVVGRDDTGGLEAQVRGSRHAWDIRLVSIDALLRLMRLKTELEDPSIIEKIRRVLMPQEFTKVDDIIHLVFSTAEEVKLEEELVDRAGKEDSAHESRKPKFVPVNFRDACVERVQTVLKQPLIKRSSAVWSTPDERIVIICINSRDHKLRNQSNFWFAFHPHQKDMVKGKAAYVAMGCGTPSVVFLIPAAEFVSWLDRFHITKLEDRLYWHIRVTKDGEKYFLRVKKGFEPVQIAKYLLKH